MLRLARERNVLRGAVPPRAPMCPTNDPPNLPRKLPPQTSLPAPCLSPCLGASPCASRLTSALSVSRSCSPVPNYLVCDILQRATHRTLSSCPTPMGPTSEGPPRATKRSVAGCRGVCRPCKPISAAQQPNLGPAMWDYALECDVHLLEDELRSTRGGCHGRVAPQRPVMEYMVSRNKLAGLQKKPPDAGDRTTQVQGYDAPDLGGGPSCPVLTSLAPVCPVSASSASAVVRRQRSSRPYHSSP
ncbi:hypothetical protein G7046_g9779 [Stylonectria norvegica]|nr:hypothetical protein G7046_g9779 [Stylonectria norvegica]